MNVWNLGGDLPISRVGFGAADIVGPYAWGPPEDAERSKAILHAALDAGITYIDTADAHGPHLAEQLIRDTLWPYPEGLVIGTKAGMTRSGPRGWGILGRPEYLTQCVELSLRHLGVERLDLLQLHRVDPKVPLAEQVGTLDALKQAGKIRHIGLSEVSVEQLGEARRLTEIVSVQNRFNLADRTHEAVLDEAGQLGIAFFPWFPFGHGALLGDGSPLTPIARRFNVSVAQLVIAWLICRSPSMIPIPGSRSAAHLAQNVAAADIVLGPDDMAEIDRIGLTLQAPTPPASKAGR